MATMISETTTKYVSKYIFTKYDRGYIISAPDRVSVYFGLSSNGLSFEVGNVDGLRYYMNLYEYYDINNRLAFRLMANWKPKDTKSAYFMRSWGPKQTAKAISKKVSNYLDELKKDAHPKALILQKKSFAYTKKVIDCLTTENFYKDLDPYIERDLLNYRAAMIALSSYGCGIFGEGISDYKQLTNNMRNWRTLFSPTNQTYSNLNKTLDNMPGGLPCGLIVNNLRQIKLERPITDRRELIFLTGFVSFNGTANFECKHIQDLIRIIQFSTRNDIQKCANKVFNEKYNLRRTDKIIDFARYIFDGCYFWDLPRNITLSGLTDHSIEWHRRFEFNVSTEEVVDKTEKTQSPPIPLPDDKHIKFLSTVGDILEEGKQMKHCISSYANNAVSGGCFLFHVEYKKQKASVEVSPHGIVQQSYGPKNTKNEASEYGRKVLGNWAQQLRNGNHYAGLDNKQFLAELNDIPF